MFNLLIPLPVSLDYSAPDDVAEGPVNKSENTFAAEDCSEDALVP